MWCSAVGCIVLLTLSLLVAPLLTAAQPVEQVRRIGILRAAGASPEAERNFEAFRHALRDLGWVEGQNLAMQCATEGGGRFPALVADLPVGQPTNEVRIYGARYS